MVDHQSSESEPPRGGDRRVRLLFLTSGILIAAVALLLIWPGLNRPDGASSGAGANGTPVPQGQSTQGPADGQKSSTGDPPIYWQMIQEQVAAGLYLSVAEAKARLQPPPRARDSLG